MPSSSALPNSRQSISRPGIPCFPWIPRPKSFSASCIARDGFTRPARFRPSITTFPVGPADCGGSNSAQKYLFKQDLQALVNDLGVEIRIAHFPSYCSKYNPIERRFFPHVGRACQGLLFDSLETVVRLMRTASTSTGLKTTVNVIRRVYEIGRAATQEFKDNVTLLFDSLLPKWNYRAVPE